MTLEELTLEELILEGLTLEEYMRELILMEKQYGHEEELYPLINMLLRENDNVKGLSVRDVHGSRGSGMEHSMLYGYASFPDLAILDEKCDLRSINASIDNTNPWYINKYNKIKDYLNRDNKEIEEINEILGENANIWKNIEKKSSKKKEKYTDEEKALINKLYGIVKYDSLSEKDEIVSELKNQAFLMYGCVEAKDKKAEEIVKEISEIKKPTQFTFCNEKKVFNNKIENIELPCNQLIGELLLYGKVLFTNGLIWKYIEIRKEDKETIRNLLLESCILKRNDWVDCLTKESGFNCMCVEIGNLTDAYEKLVKNDEEDKLANLKDKFEPDDEKVTEEVQKWKDEWARQWIRLKYNLAHIDWKGEEKEANKDGFDNSYDQFITEEDLQKNESTENPTP